MDTSDQYYVLVDGQQVGPYSMSEITDQLATGTLAADSLYSSSGMTEWMPLKTLIQDIPPKVSQTIKSPEQQRQPVLTTSVYNKWWFWVIMLSVYIAWSESKRFRDNQASVEKNQSIANTATDNTTPTTTPASNAEPVEYWRQYFLGKTMDDIKMLLGPPDHTVSKDMTWGYRDRIIHPVTGKKETLWIDFRESGRVDSFSAGIGGKTYGL